MNIMDIKRGDRDENGQHDSNFSLELAGRNGDHEVCSDQDNTILTISIDDGHNLEILSESLLPEKCFTWCRKKLLSRIDVILLFGSLLLLLISATLVEVLNIQRTGAARKALLTIRSVGIFTFFGQLSMFFAHKIAFSDNSFSCTKRSSYIEAHRITQILKHFLLSVIFEENAVADYFRRSTAVREQDINKRLLEILDSSEFEGFISDKVEQIFSSAEGTILNVIGAEKSELFQISKLFINEIICRIHPLVYKDRPSNNMTLEAIRRHVETIASQQFNTLDNKEINQFLDRIVARKFSKMSVPFFVFLAFIGCIVQLVYTYRLLQT